MFAGSFTRVLGMQRMFAQPLSRLVFFQSYCTFMHPHKTQVRARATPGEYVHELIVSVTGTRYMAALALLNLCDDFSAKLYVKGGGSAAPAADEKKDSDPVVDQAATPPAVSIATQPHAPILEGLVKAAVVGATPDIVFKQVFLLYLHQTRSSADAHLLWLSPEGRTDCANGRGQRTSGCY